MKIAFFVNTPAQAHLFIPITKILKEKGHETIILARSYRETIDVLNGKGINYILYTKSPKSKYTKILLSFPHDVLVSYKYLRRFKPDLVIGHSVDAVFTAQLLKKPSIVFNDNDFAPIQFVIIIPFVNAIITPKCFKRDLGEKQIRVDSFKEIAYLHPDYFSPDKNILNLMNISPKEKFVLLRFNAFDAVHDTGTKGFSYKEKKELVTKLEKHAKIFISFEGMLPPDMAKYSLKIPKHRIHDVLYYAQMVVADSNTIITESAVLGTPSIVAHPKVNQIGNFIELGEKNSLIFKYENTKEAIDKAVELIQQTNLKDEWKKKKDVFLKNKVNMIQFMVWFIENYPQSFKEIKEKPDMQYKFK
ncbi:Uncharacterised protein [uncultured archaeon]|nr:Uncharacterised protein [uncultured archaeon]